MKAALILTILRFVMGAVALGIGIWYLSSSTIGGSALTYTSMDSFLNSIGAGNDIASANGCFLCGYISELFGIIGRATEMFWTAIVDHLWILMSVGFGIFLFVYSMQYIFNAMKKTAEPGNNEQKLEFKAWFDKVWRQGARIMFVGALMGMLGMGGTTALRTVSHITITPVLFVGAELSMAASGVSSATQCGAMTTKSDEIFAPIIQPFMCVVGNLNSIMLAGAAGGFALMNYAWMGLGGGVLTWVAGLALVILFMVIGFKLFFHILSVVFKLIFFIIFMPIFLAAAAFEPVWSVASKLMDKAIGEVVKSAVQIVGITLKVLIMYATISYAADEFFPGPNDGYSAILPPMMRQKIKNPDAQTLSVMNVFSECERISLTDGEVDGDKFKDCFMVKKAAVERQYPGAFDFMKDGWNFMMLMIGLFLLYYYAVEPKIDGILGKISKESSFDFGGQIKQFGKNIWNFPVQIAEKVTKAIGK